MNGVSSCEIITNRNSRSISYRQHAICVCVGGRSFFFFLLFCEFSPISHAHIYKITSVHLIALHRDSNQFNSTCKYYIHRLVDFNLMGFIRNQKKPIAQKIGLHREWLHLCKNQRQSFTEFSIHNFRFVTISNCVL